MRLLLPLFLILSGCSGPSSVEELLTRDVTLPGGQVIKTETAVDTRDILRGFMFRTSLKADHGMLFVHPVTGNYSTWMYQTNFPLDMIWMDQSHTVVELVEQAPPCKTVASKCPHYGGHEKARFILELKAGLIRKYGVKTGDKIQW